MIALFTRDSRMHRAF